MDPSQSNNEDFRSVIDDLTVENKKLKQRLRRYEELHCSHLQGEKVFEVRMHGLPPHKKRELEETLRNFASRLGDSPGRTSRMSSPPRLCPLLGQDTAVQKPPSSTTSYSRPVDSAYASMSASGQTSVSHSQYPEKHKPVAIPQRNSQSNNIYLQDIPEGLLPRNSPVMTEKSKQKLVVRRLEQLFTGNGACAVRQSESLQQQEVSRSAAKADQSAIEAAGHRVEAEGVREARILPLNIETAADHIGEARIPFQLHTLHSRDEFESDGTNISSGTTPDQRPTRPLDLDPFRVQVPADNIDYIRHLGLESPRMNPGLNPAEGTGWVYLNLLISMAQLHTANVTPGFVRKAVADISTKFELSEDGGKIRWRGGMEATQLSSDSSSPAEQSKETLPFEPYKANSEPRKLMASNSSTSDMDLVSGNNAILHSSNSHSTVECESPPKRRPVFSGQFNGEAKFDYKPLLFRGAHLEEDEDEEEECSYEGDSSMPSGPAESFTVTRSASEAFWNAATLLEPTRRRKENGPIIYYSRVKFCTDLSGDRDGSPYEPAAYSKLTEVPLGCAPTAKMKPDAGHSEGNDSPWENQSPMKLKHNDLESQDDWTLVGLEPLQATEFEDAFAPIAPVILEASGIGGVQPRDNFAVEVRTRHGIGRRSSIPHLRWLSSKHHNICLKSLGAFRSSRSPIGVPSQHSFTSEIISAKLIALSPSPLPPPSYVFLPFSSSGSENNDDDERSNFDSGHDAPPNSASAVELDGRAPPTFPHFAKNTTQESFPSSSDADSDGSSIDLLAHARELDPDTIAAQEWEFDKCLAQTFVAGSPAGCSVATVGGGNGSSSNGESLMTSDDDESMHGLKRRRSGEGSDTGHAKVPRIEFRARN